MSKFRCSMHAESFQSWVANSGTQTRSIRVHSLPMCVDLDERERETDRQRERERERERQDISRESREG